LRRALSQDAKQQSCCHDHYGRQDQAAVAGGSGRRPVVGFFLDKEAMGLSACHGGVLASDYWLIGSSTLTFKTIEVAGCG
jgi:hypothetical protein